MTDLTIVTGIWDLGRDQADPSFRRPFQHYLAHFATLLTADVPMVVFGDASLREFVLATRGRRPTDFRVRDAASFDTDFAFAAEVDRIRTRPDWTAQAAWLAASPQATLPRYNPMVMSKMFMLHDASIWNPFGSSHMAWIDGGITSTVHPGYFTHDRVFERVSALLEKFRFVSFPYPDGAEIHGFPRSAMAHYCGTDPQWVCRGGFFGGHIDCISAANAHYYDALGATLQAGHMGTEESVFTIMAHESPELYDVHALSPDDGGLLGPFFEAVKQLPLRDATRATPRNVPTRSTPPTLAGYVVTYNAPAQLADMLETWRTGFRFDALFILDHSIDPAARAANAALAAQLGATILHHPKGNGGICGGRQFVAEHFATTAYDYYLFLEDDMFLNPVHDAGVCRGGMRRAIGDPHDVLLRIMDREGFDFLKLSYTEFFGDNGTQWAWYNVPQSLREQRWPEKPRLPTRGTDPDAPRTRFERINTVDGVAYTTGEVYYCNWPQLVSRDGNQRMFLDTVFEHPFEQSWMSHMYQLTLRGALKPGVLLASLVTHDRVAHYPAGERREN